MAGEKLSLAQATESGFFTTHIYSAEAGTGQEWGTVGTGAEAVFYKSNVDATLTDGDVIASVTGASGTMTLTLGDKGGNAVTEISALTSSKKWVIKDAKATSGTLATIIGSNQDDLFTLTVGGESDIKTDLGKDTIDISSIASGATISDYTYGSDVIKVLRQVLRTPVVS